MASKWIWIRLRESTISAARAALKILGIQLYDESRIEPDPMRKSHLRAEGDHYMLHEREIQAAEHRGSEHKPDIPKDERD